MKFTFAPMEKIRNVRASPVMVEQQPQPKVSVLVPTGPRANRSFIWVSSHDAEIYPLAFCVAFGMVIATYSGVCHLAFNPDVNLSRERREKPAWERYNPEEGKTFSRNRHHFANLKLNPVNTFLEAEKLKEWTDETFLLHL